ncbi:MAG: hypothetical protein QNK37_21035 [Acidobacteriota bacterium]|nr:hypothetical protein [Acidobacteriota bacterium]
MKKKLALLLACAAAFSFTFPVIAHSTCDELFERIGEVASEGGEVEEAERWLAIYESLCMD